MQQDAGGLRKSSMRAFIVESSADALRTQGLVQAQLPEIELTLWEEEYESEARELLEGIASHLLSVHRGKAVDGLAYRHGFWIVQLRQSSSESAEIWELSRGGSDYVPGARATLEFFRAQRRRCDYHQASFEPPDPFQYVMISEGVWDGEPTEGVRYPAAPNMSGWWFSTDLYDGDVRSMQREHDSHLAEKRPDLVEFLALPAGTRIRVQPGHEPNVWFDNEVASQEPL
jgi:hypothetical protein